jgi:predicted secreted Zn-dependent protease
MKDEYTIRSAVYEALMEKPKNTDFYFTDFISEVRRKLREHGNPAKPMDGTIQRAMRLMRRSFDIKCVDYRKSIYRIVE